MLVFYCTFLLVSVSGSAPNSGIRLVTLDDLTRRNGKD